MQALKQCSCYMRDVVLYKLQATTQKTNKHKHTWKREKEQLPLVILIQNVANFHQNGIFHF